MNKFSKQKLNKRNKQKYTQANEPISATFDIIIVKQELLTNILINYMKTTATSYASLSSLWKFVRESVRLNCSYHILPQFVPNKVLARGDN